MSLPEYLRSLTDEQRAAAASEDRFVAIQACAGSGKTETIGARVVHLLAKGVPAEEIVAFTFTEKAAANLKQRIGLRVREHLGHERERDLGLLSVGTIHAYCLRLLQDFGERADFEILDENREYALISRRHWDLGLLEAFEKRFGEKVKQSKAIEIFGRSIDAVYNEMIDRKRLAKREPDFSRMLDQYEDILFQRRLMGYGQIIEQASLLAEDRSRNLKPVRHLIVDEYQDINPAQERLIRAYVARGACLYVVGDAQQCIYQWRGSDIGCFVEFGDRWKNSRVLPLSLNRRSREPIIRNANRFGKERLPGYAPMTAYRKFERPCIYHRRFATDVEEADFIADTIKKYEKEGVPLRNMAVLLRSVRTSGRPILRALASRGLPSVVLGSAGLFMRPETQAIGACFAWAAGTPFKIDPAEWGHNNLGDAELSGLLADSIRPPLRAPSLARLRAWRDRLINLKGHTLIEAYQELLTLFDFAKLDPRSRVHAAAMANLGRFNELITDFESTRFRLSQSGQGTNLRRWKEKPESRPRLLQSLGWHMNFLGWDSYEERPPEDSRVIEAVSVSTVHQSKGLEWNVVFVPALVALRFPSRKRKSQWALSDDLFPRARYEGSEADEARAFYVAVTRARDACFLSSFRMASGGKRESQSSPFVEIVAPHTPPPEGALAPCDPNNPEDPWVTFSPSELFTYRRCPHQYLMRQVWGYQPQLKEELGYGKAVHAMMREVGSRAAAGEKVTPAAAAKVVEDGFYMPYASKQAFGRMKTKAAEVVSDYVAQHASDLSRTQSVESRVEFRLAGGDGRGAVIRGVADVILRANDEEEVRDYKTSEEAALATDVGEFQVRLYALGLREVGRNVTRGSLVDLSSSKVLPVTVGEDDLRRTRESASRLTDSILNGDFTPKPSKEVCGDCDVQRICRYAAK